MPPSPDLGTAFALRDYDVRYCADRFLVWSSAIKNFKILSTYAITGTFPRDNAADFTANASTNILTSSGHGLNNGELINFTTDDTLPGGIGSWDDGFFYYVINVTTNTFQIALTPGGSAIDITSTGSGTHTWYTDTNKVVITHNLGYYSGWLFNYTGSTGLDGRNKVNFMSDGTFYLDVRIYLNTTEIYISTSFGRGYGDYSPGDTLYFTAYQGRDPFDEYEAPITSVGTDSDAASDDVGMAYAKEGFDVRTCLNTDLIFSTNFFSALIHKIGVAVYADANVDEEFIYSHGLSYVPSVFPYLKPAGKDYLTIGNDRVHFTSSSMVFTFIDPDEELYYILFKNRTV